MISLSNQPALNRGRVIVWGQMGASPFGGMIWQVLHHLSAFRRLGFDTYYVEDSDRPLYDPVTYDPTWDCTYNVKLLSRYMESAGFGDRWIFRPPEVYDVCYGAANLKGLKSLYEEAEAVFNLCGSQELRDEHAQIRCLVYLETDPVKNQVEVANGDQERIRELDAYHYLFTYGENLGAADCCVPIQKYQWNPTRPPVCIDWWDTACIQPSRSVLTTIANWKHKGKDIVWKGETWHWSKHFEFLKFIDLPKRSKLPLELAVGAIGREDREKLQHHSWRTIASSTLEDPDSYRKYIQTSLGELTVAKEQYVKPRSGWFSDRSVCYLAAGRPVIMQDTGFGNSLPTGRGLFSFSTQDEALAAIEEVARDYAAHSAAAFEIAKEYFDGERVLGDICRKVGLL